MTREELKRHCEKQIEECERWSKHKGEEPHGKIYEEHKLILELLEQQPCEDAISRADAVRVASGYCHPANIAKELAKLPPVTPIRPKGHWIGRKRIGFGEWADYVVPLKDGFVMDSCSCSECGEWLTGSDEYQCSGNFCPNCGADMREVEESEG
jgi:hypothetical protein